MSPSKKVKQLFRKNKSGFSSLKTYVKSLIESADETLKKLAENWVAEKHGYSEKVAKDLRFKNKGSTLAAIRQASKNARKK